MWLGAAAMTLSFNSCAEEEPMPETIQDLPYATAATGTFTEWPTYNPTIHYNLNEDPEFKDLPMPTKNLPWISRFCKVGLPWKRKFRRSSLKGYSSPKHRCMTGR